MASIIVNKYVEVNEKFHKFLGKLYRRPSGQIVGKKKCCICGEWFTWDVRLAKGVEPHNCNDTGVVYKEKHGTSLCDDWQYIATAHQKEVAEEKERALESRGISNFMKLLRAGQI